MKILRTFHQHERTFYYRLRPWNLCLRRRQRGAPLDYLKSGSINAQKFKANYEIRKEQQKTPILSYPQIKKLDLNTISSLLQPTVCCCNSQILETNDWSTSASDTICPSPAVLGLQLRNDTYAWIAHPRASTQNFSSGPQVPTASASARPSPLQVPTWWCRHIIYSYVKLKFQFEARFFVKREWFHVKNRITAISY